MCAHTRRMALFGMAIQVFFESTTPLLHLLGCLKLAGLVRGRLYLAAGAVSSRNSALASPVSTPMFIGLNV